MKYIEKPIRETEEKPIRETEEKLKNLNMKKNG